MPACADDLECELRNGRTCAKGAAITTARRSCPQRLVEDIAKTTSLAREHWAKARTASDFSAFAPWLEKILGLVREQADCWGYADEALRRTARHLRARRACRGTRCRCSTTSKPGWPRCSRVCSPRRKTADPRAARGQLPHRRAAAVQPARGREHGLRFRGRPHRLDRASVLHRDGAEGLSAHDALQREGFHQRAFRRHARGGARPLHAGPADGAVRHADGHVRVARHPRIAVSPVGKPSRP